MVQEINSFKFFYLAHGIMGLECLNGLLSDDIIPDLVITHLDYEKEKYYENFYLPIEELCLSNSIKHLKTKSLSDMLFFDEPYKNPTRGLPTDIVPDFSLYDAGICVGFMEIIRNNIFSIPSYGILNLHCGKLPFYRGRAPISRTLIDGNSYLTMTIHKIDEGVDSGDILLEKEIEISDDDNVNTLYEKCCEISSEAVKLALEKLQKGKATFMKQDLEKHPEANKKISEEESRIDWSKSSRQIHNLIRAITIPYPCAKTYFGDNKLCIIESEIITEDGTDFQNGEVVNVDNEMISVQCGKGILGIKRLCISGQGEIDKSKFSKGDFFV